MLRHRKQLCLLRVRGRIAMVFFFFSSRRRHTRCSRDWSSDVCSSDLHDVQGFLHRRGLGLPEESEHSEIRCGGAQDLAKSKRRHDSVHAVARRTAPFGRSRRNHRKLPDEALPGQPRHGPGSLRAPVSSERNRNRPDPGARSQATISSQNARARQSRKSHRGQEELLALHKRSVRQPQAPGSLRHLWIRDRKSTRLNSSHGYISYAVFCLKKKKTKHYVSKLTFSHHSYTQYSYS